MDDSTSTISIELVHSSPSGSNTSSLVNRPSIVSNSEKYEPSSPPAYTSDPGPPATADGGSGGGLSTGAIVGIVVAILAIAGAVVGYVVLRNADYAKQVTILDAREVLIRQYQSQFEAAWAAQRNVSAKTSCLVAASCGYDAPGLAFDERYDTEVDHSTVAIKYPPGTNLTDPDIIDSICASRQLHDTWKSNYEASVSGSSDALLDGLSWQYVSDIRTAYIDMHPATSWSDESPVEADGCSPYDPRFRPWFAAAASGPKDVVILVDTSGSMSTASGETTRMELAKEAIKTVLGALAYGDYAAVVQFNSVASVVGKGFEKVTNQGLTDLALEIDNLRPNGGTDFQAGFQTAFDELEKSGSGCKQVILFLTDGEADDPSGVIDSRDPNHETVILSYALGAGATPEIPLGVACNNSGVFYDVPDGADLKTIMAGFHNYFSAGISPTGNTDVRWSEPYVEVNTGSILTSCAVACYDRTVDPENPEFIGVVSTDVFLNEISGFSGQSALFDRLDERAKECLVLDVSPSRLAALRVSEGQVLEC